MPLEEHWGSGVKKANRQDVIRWGLYGLVVFLVPTVSLFLPIISAICFISIIVIFVYFKENNVSPNIMTALPAAAAFFLITALMISEGLVNFEYKYIILDTYLILLGSITMMVGLGLTRVFLHKGSWTVFIVLPLSIIVSYMTIITITKWVLRITGWCLG